MPTQLSNNYKDKLMRAGINFASDVFKACLMGASFVYNPTTHNVYTDVGSYELATGGGYTHGGLVLTGVTVTRDDVNNKCRVTWNNASWAASGADIGPSSGVILIDDTSATDLVVGFLDFGSLKTTLDGGTFTVSGITIDQL